MTLDLTPLLKALAKLDEGMKRHLREPSDDQVRDGLIQRFELTYEQCHKMLRRYLDGIAPTPGTYTGADFQEIIRSANRAGMLLGDWPRWRAYRQMRAKTSHTYDENVALQVVGEIPAFLADAKHLLAQLEARQA